MQGQDLASGNITAPTIFALERSPRLRQLLQSRFKEEGSLDEALLIVKESGSINLARNMAAEEGKAARKALDLLPSSPSKQSLLMLVDYVLARLH